MMNIDITNLKEETINDLFSCENLNGGIDEIAAEIADKQKKNAIMISEIYRETDKAIRAEVTIFLREGNQIAKSTSAWLPKSQIEIISDIEKTDVWAIVPYWLAKKI